MEENEEIVQVLECCIKEEHKDCPQCGEFVSQFDCMRNVISNALDLIRRLQADNIQLKWNYVDLKERYVKVLDLNEKVIAKQNAEIERLTGEKDKYQEKWQTSYMNELNLQKQVDELREENTELYKEHTALIAGSILRKKQVQKDTAKEIFEKMLFEFRHYGKNEKLTKPQVLGTLEKIVKSKGVEVE